MVAGLQRADAGSIRIFGIDAIADPLVAKAVVAWVPDEPLLYDKLTPFEYLEFVAGLWRVNADVAQARAEQLLRELSMWDHRDARCETISRGVKQKVALAGALVHAPRLLILDEPLAGLDAGAARQAKTLLADRVAQGATVILTTHILEVAERMADHIGVIRAGWLVAEGTLAELQAANAADATLEELFLALASDP
jgi:ABC-2 type transport system ATP-binding protein